MSDKTKDKKKIIKINQNEIILNLGSSLLEMFFLEFLKNHKNEEIFLDGNKIK